MPEPLRLARRWVPGGGEPDIRLLSRGLVHATYRVRRDAGLYALRVPVAPRAVSAFDPLWESRVLAAAESAGLGPVVAGGDPAAGVLVTRWVHGRTWTPAQAAQPDTLQRIAELARRIHALTPARPLRAMGPADWIAHYAGVLARSGAPPRGETALLAQRAASRVAALAALPPAGRVLCHSDLHPLNLLDGERGITVLDWEYAHFSDPLWDLAGWISANDFGAAQGRDLLASYRGGEPAEGEWPRLQLLAWLYDYVCLLWSDVYLIHTHGGAAAPSAVAARARLLAARLASSTLAVR